MAGNFIAGLLTLRVHQNINNIIILLFRSTARIGKCLIDMEIRAT